LLGGYRLDFFGGELVDESDEWQVRLEFADEAGVTTHSLTSTAEVSSYCGCRAVQLTVSPDGSSLDDR
jgi:hypothetical protein